MQLIDLSHPIKSGDLVFEGMEKPALKALKKVEEHGFAITEFTLHSHNGTHVDAPSHMLANTRTLSDFAVDKFHGTALQIPCAKFAKHEIPLSYLKIFESKIRQVEYVILNTGWSEKWNTPAYYDNFPVLSEESAKWLTNFKLKGLACDVVSVDHIKSQTVPIHIILLSKEILIIENLTNLNTLGADPFTFQCLPLKFDKIDGSPIRAVAFVD